MVSILHESITFLRSSPRTFSLITLALVFPLSFAVLAHALITHPLLLRFLSTNHSSDLFLLLLYQFLYILFLLTVSLISTAAVVFTVSALYVARPVSFHSTLSAIPAIFSRLFRTFLWVALLMLGYNSSFVSFLILLFLSFSPDSTAFLLSYSLLLLIYLVVHVYITAVWHLASVVSVLEPVDGFEAMAKSNGLLRGRTRWMAIGFVLGYIGACEVIGYAFEVAVVKGKEEGGLGIWAKVLVGAALVTLQVVVSLLGLLVESVFYYFCRLQELPSRAD